MDAEMKDACDAWKNKTRDRIIYKGYWLLRPDLLLNFHLTIAGALTQPEFNEIMDYLNLPIKIVGGSLSSLRATIDTPWGIRDVEWHAYLPEILDPNYA